MSAAAGVVRAMMSQAGSSELVPGEMAGDNGRQECPPDTDDRDLWFYRDRTVALLKRYVRMAVETGRLPSLLGKECFRAQVTAYAMTSFEDMVIFVHDMEMALRRLSEFQQQLVALCVLEEYSLLDAAWLLRTPLRSIERELPETLDELSRILLATGLMIGMAPEQKAKQTCQEGKKCHFPVSDCNHGKNNL